MVEEEMPMVVKNVLNGRFDALESKWDWMEEPAVPAYEVHVKKLQGNDCNIGVDARTTRVYI